MNFSLSFFLFVVNHFTRSESGQQENLRRWALGLVKRKVGLCDMAEFDIHVSEDTNTEKEKERRVRHEYDEIVRCTLSSSRPKNI
jgi:hypothetical protein